MAPKNIPTKSSDAIDRAAIATKLAIVATETATKLATSTAETATKLAVETAVMSTNIEVIKADIFEIKNNVRSLTGEFITKVEFAPVRNITFGLVGLILVSVVGALVTLVLR